MKIKFSVTGMTCSACSSNVERALKGLEGIENVNVNVLTNSMTADIDENILSTGDVIKKIQGAGYGAQVFGQKQETQKDDNSEEQSVKFRLIISFLFLIPLMYISMYHMFPYYPMPDIFIGSENAITVAFSQFLLTLPIIYVNRKYYQVGFKALYKKSPNMDTLIAIGSGAALVYGVFAIFRIGYALGQSDLHTVHKYSMDLYFESAAMILALITLGKYLEARSKGKTSEAISKLIDLTPKTATVIRNGEEIEISVSDVVVDDIIVIKPGQSIPVDGIIIEGSSSVDQAAITGESIPVEKNVGDKVISATINKAGAFKFKAQKVGDDTTISQIIKLVEEASSSKAPISKLADKISGIFVPVVIVISVIAFIVWMMLGYSFEFALSIAISVLVISCPCALGLATPVAIMVGTGKGAENGILIKSAEALELAHSVKTVILDKTGTITEGKPRVTDVIALGGIEQKQLMDIAYSLEKMSEHPLASAIVQKAEEDKASVLNVDKFEAVSGRGIQAEIQKEKYFAGNLQWLKDNNIALLDAENIAHNMAEIGKTPLYFANHNSVIGIIAVMDNIKPTSKQAIQTFKNLGIDVVMLTGDNKKTAAAIQKQLGITKVIAEVMPQDKENEVRVLQESGKRVAMIGDGVNDAPALTRADVGIAIGAGTDIAIESADIVLVKGDLLDAVTAIELSKSVIKNIKMNLFWAFFYNSIGIPLAAGVFYVGFGLKLNPMFGALAMSLSSVCVVLNALRLRLFKPTFSNVEKNIEILNVTQEIEEDKEGVDEQMKKIITVEGMSCGHCQANVEKVLSELNGVKSAKVDLKKKTATVTLDAEVADNLLMDTINTAGYQAISIETKKGLFDR